MAEVIQNTNWYGRGYAGTGIQAAQLHHSAPSPHLGMYPSAYQGHRGTGIDIRGLGSGLNTALGAAGGLAGNAVRSRTGAFSGLQPLNADTADDTDKGFTPPNPSLYNWASETPKSRTGSFASRLAGAAVGAIRSPQAPF